jgi:hypothetical protein
MVLEKEFCMLMDNIRKTIHVGKEEGYSLDKEMNKPIPPMRMCRFLCPSASKTLACRLIHSITAG